MSQNNQVDSFVQATSAAVKDAVPLPPDEPKVPFQTALRLTGPQEKAMLEFAFSQFDKLNTDSGRSNTISPTWWSNLAPASATSTGGAVGQGLGPADTFLGKRSRYDATFLNDVSWRPAVLGGIFTDSNLCVPLSRRIARQMIARAQNAFFGSAPWFNVDPRPEPSTELDDGLAEKINNFVRFKMEESGSVSDKRAVLRQTLVLGECAVKTSYVVRDQLFNAEAQVLTDVEGQELVGEDQNIITHDDPVDEIEGNAVLARDKVTVLPSAPIWQKKMLNRRQILFEGARSEPIFFKDFLCTMTATDVQTAECCIHLYDKPVMMFVDLVVKRGMVDDNPDARLSAVQKMSTLVRQIASNSPQPKSAVNQELRPGENSGTSLTNSNSGPIAEFAEFYMWFDANGDGVAENIMLIADRTTRMPIFYDHVANVTTDGLRPIEIIRINPVQGRWYGQGVMELFESYQTVVDLMVNRWNFSQSRSGRIDLWDPTATLEGDRDPNLKVNWGKTYTKKPNKKKEDVLESIYLNDTKFESLQTMTQFFTQLAMNESGVANANDNYVAGMEQAKLATGINEIAKSGDELFNPILADLQDPMERLLTREVEVILSNMNPEEAYTFLEGDTMGMDTLTPDDVRGLKYKIRIHLTQQKNQQTFTSAKAAAELVEKFYMLTPEIQVRVAPFYRKMLKSVDPHCNADQAIVAGVAMIPPEGGAGGEAQPGGVPGQTYQGSAPQPASAAA